MWVLIMTMVLTLQEVGTRAEVHVERIEGIASKELCESGKREFIATHEFVATEPRSDYEAPEGDPDATQPKKDQWQLLKPAAFCVQVR